MSDLNNLSIQGRLVRDAELRTTDNGLKILNFTIATNRARKNDEGNWESIGNFFPISIFGAFAERMEPLLKKGQRLIIEGFLKQNRWTQDGENRSATFIGVDKIHLISDSKSEIKSTEKTVPAEDIENIPLYEEPRDEVYIDNLQNGAIF